MDPPEGFARWSLRLLADQVVELGYIDSVSHETVRRVLKKNELKPWRAKGWVIPPEHNSSFVAHMERVLDVLQATVRSPASRGLHGRISQATDRRDERSSIPGLPGRVARHDYEYRRCGVCTVFLASEPLAGKRMVRITERRTKQGLGPCSLRRSQTSTKARRRLVGPPLWYHLTVLVQPPPEAWGEGRRVSGVSGRPDRAGSLPEPGAGSPESYEDRMVLYSRRHCSMSTFALLQRIEDFPLQKLLAECSIEALVIAILPRACRRDE